MVQTNILVHGTIQTSEPHHDAYLAFQTCDTKLLDAASRGKKEIVKALVKIKANVNCKDQVK